jgi:hypothetical protein
MTWKEQLLNLERTNDWKNTIKFLEQEIRTDLNNVEIYVRVLFLLLDFLVEGKHSQEEYIYAAAKLKKYFEESYKRFYNNAEYLFFLGYFIVIAEWYFGIDDVTIAYDMRKKAMELEPDNILYEWSYRFSDPENQQAIYLAKQLLNHEKSKIKWLQSKGKVGEYILGMIEYCYKK